MVNGKPRHPQSQGSVERANGDIKDMLVAWMADNNTTDWSVGIKFVQFHKNSGLHSGIQRSPYTAMFGCEAKVGLTTSSLPTEIVERMQTEDDLLSAISISSQENVQVNSEQMEMSLDIEALPGPSATCRPTVPPHDDSFQILSEGETTFRTQEMPVLTPVPATPNISGTDCAEPPLMSPAVPYEMLRARMNNIHSERSAASSSQLIQAERMVKRSRLELPTTNPGDNVAVPIPLVDRGRGDPRNILGVVLNHDANDLYTICVKSGILKGTFACNQFDICPQALLQKSDVNQTRTVTLHAAVK